MGRVKAFGTVISWFGMIMSLTGASFTIVLLIEFLPFGTVVTVALLATMLIYGALGRYLFRLGRRMSQDSTAQRMARDSRPVVLLLRAFESDGEVAERNWLRQRSLLAILLGRETVEEELARVLEDVGPTVALGRKGELIPTFGFAKEYAQDDNWQAVISSYFDKAGWLVFVLSTVTPNLTYEITEALSRKYAAKILLVPPVHRDRHWRDAYAALSSNCPSMPALDDETAAAIVIDARKGQTTVRMAGRRSRHAQVSAIQKLLVENYLIA
jgi:hypothetical protein